MTDRPIIFRASMINALLAGRKTQTRRVVRDEVPAPPADNCIGSNNRIRHDEPYLDAYCGERRTPSNPRGMSDRWCWWTRDDRQGLPTFRVGCQPGDRLWVREAHVIANDGDGADYLVRYAADAKEVWVTDPTGNWMGMPDKRVRASTQMPRWASRLTLDVTDVRVQRLQDISEADAVAEGCEPYAFPGPWWQGYRRDEDGELDYQQAVGDAPPDWMIEPHRMRSTPHLDRSAAEDFRSRFGTDEWAENPWVAALSFTVRHGNIDAPVAEREASDA